jgi:hypothetical protein
MTVGSAAPAAETTTPPGRRTPEAMRVDAERFLSTVGRLRAELLDARNALAVARGRTAALDAELHRLRADVAALRVARDAALRVAAWGGPRHRARACEAPR